MHSTKSVQFLSVGAVCARACACGCSCTCARSRRMWVYMEGEEWGVARVRWENVY